jgi:polyprenyl-phospho-N-acetylgalactosaminyl synthase
MRKPLVRPADCVSGPMVGLRVVLAPNQHSGTGNHAPLGTWVVVPAYNEEGVIGRVVGELRAEYNVVVVDDGSRDATYRAAEAAGACVVRHTINRGQGAALQTGIEFSLARNAHTIVTFDADGQHQVEDVKALLAALDAGAHVSLGSRFLGRIRGASRGRIAFLRVAVWISNRLSGLRLTDAHCGLRAFRADMAPRLAIHQDRMAHASELLANVRRSGLRCTEVPVTILYTEYSVGKGQRATDGIRVLFEYLAGLVR